MVRWRLKDLTLWVWEEFRISISETTLSRELRALGYRKLSARPRHYAQNPEALEAFKKSLPATLEIDPGEPPERHPHRAVVTGRGACGPEEQDRPPLGSAALEAGRLLIEANARSTATVMDCPSWIGPGRTSGKGADAV